MATKSYAVTGVVIKYLEGSTNSVYANWTAPKDIKDLKEYQITWQYHISGNSWPNDGTVQTTKSTKSPLYSIPDNPKIDKIRAIIKPIPTDTKKWTGTKVEKEMAVVKLLPPDVPPAPVLSIPNKYDNKTMTLVIEVDGIDVTGENAAEKIEVEVHQSQGTGQETKYLLYKTLTFSVDSTGHVRHHMDNMDYSKYYRARARAISAKGHASLWSDFGESIESRPNTPLSIEKIKVLSTEENAVCVHVAEVKTAKSYEVEYTTDYRYFDKSDGLVQSQTSPIREVVISGIAKSGKSYAFRARAINATGVPSAWTPHVIQSFGVTANPPTTWSSDTSVILGDKVDLYWMHNSADGSDPTQHVITIDIYNLSTLKTDTVTVIKDGNYLKNETTKYYTFDTSKYGYDFIMYWSVRTSGITGELSKSSTVRQINVYQRPSLSIATRSMPSDNVLYGLPLVIYGHAGPDSQTAITYLLEVIATESYEDVDYLGNPVYVTEGDSVYSKVISENGNTFEVILGPSEINLGNEISYEIRCVVSMDSGLKAVSNTIPFRVRWSEELPIPNAGYYIENEESVTVGIMPWCKNDKDELQSDVELAVYRISHGGDFIEIGSQLPNSPGICVIDPHPSLNYARYRIVATSIRTGAISFFDIDSIELNVKSVIIQWDERFHNYIGYMNEGDDHLGYANGSMIRLDWNIDISQSHDPDVELIEYIGRTEPVSYYGTQKKETANWNVEIPAYDLDTLYRIRQLARYSGDVYVREPSGTGYWAQVKVSYNTKHNSTTIPITLSITRVEGGM